MSELVKVIDLHKIYKGDVYALRGVSLNVDRGEFVAIVGVSGSGKSTLLNIIGLLDPPTKGKVFLDGVDTSLITDNERTKIRNEKIGFVFQHHNLLSELTALENVIVPALIAGREIEESKEKAKMILSSMGLSEKRFLHRPFELSGGEQQRVAVARALINNPLLVLGDEPTGNLDSKTSKEVYDLMRELNREKGITFIIVTHNEKIASRADRIVRLADGIIEE
jgi:lipoprotein-releasing system ATP-binding protein